MSCVGCSYEFCDLVRLWGDEIKFINFLEAHGVLQTKKLCPNCDIPCKFYLSAFKVMCVKSKIVTLSNCKKVRKLCGFSTTARKGTFFENTNVSPLRICDFVLQWLFFNESNENLIEENFCMDPDRAVDWSNFCRGVCADALIFDSACIGGPNIVVEIDEVLVGTRKDNQEALVNGQWLFGGIEHGTRKSFFVPVENKCRESLLEIIKKWILPGTVIISDCWKTYDCLSHEEYTQLGINRSLIFKHQDSPIYMQNIWKHIRKIHGHQEPFYGHLAEYIYKWKLISVQKLYHKFFLDIGMLYPPALDIKHDEGVGETPDAIETPK